MKGPKRIARRRSYNGENDANDPGIPAKPRRARRAPVRTSIIGFRSPQTSAAELTAGRSVSGKARLMRPHRTCTITAKSVPAFRRSAKLQAGAGLEL
jgi:hypothetical protein